jgi:RNA polymerase sigma-70 factor, ECF subfamily
MFSIDALYEQHSEQIYRFIYLLVLDESLAEDLVQETFLNAYKARYTYKGLANPLTWLRKIAKNCVLDQMKSKKKYFWQTYEELQEQSAMTISTEQLASMNEERKRLYVAIAQLPLDYRLAIALRKIEELSIKQTAQILSWNEIKVQNTTARAMEALEKLLKGEDMANERSSRIISKGTKRTAKTTNPSKHSTEY